MPLDKDWFAAEVASFQDLLFLIPATTIDYNGNGLLRQAYQHLVPQPHSTELPKMRCCKAEF